MKAEVLVEPLFLNTNEPIKWRFKATQFTPSTEEYVNFITGMPNARMELYVNGNTFSSEDGYIAFKDGGFVTIDLSNTTKLYANQEYNVRLKVFDDDHPKGRYLVHEDKEMSCAVFKVSK